MFAFVNNLKSLHRFCTDGFFRFSQVHWIINKYKKWEEGFRIYNLNIERQLIFRILLLLKQLINLAINGRFSDLCLLWNISQKYDNSQLHVRVCDQIYKLSHLYQWNHHKSWIYLFLKSDMSFEKTVGCFFDKWRKPDTKYKCINYTHLFTSLGFPNNKTIPRPISSCKIIQQQDN